MKNEREKKHSKSNNNISATKANTHSKIDECYVLTWIFVSRDRSSCCCCYIFCSAAILCALNCRLCIWPDSKITNYLHSTKIQCKRRLLIMFIIIQFKQKKTIFFLSMQSSNQMKKCWPIFKKPSCMYWKL